MFKSTSTSEVLKFGPASSSLTLAINSSSSKYKAASRDSFIEFVSLEFSSFGVAMATFESVKRNQQKYLIFICMKYCRSSSGGDKLKWDMEMILTLRLWTRRRKNWQIISKKFLNQIVRIKPIITSIFILLQH